MSNPLFVLIVKRKQITPTPPPKKNSSAKSKGHSIDYSQLSPALFPDTLISTIVYKRRKIQYFQLTVSHILTLKLIKFREKTSLQDLPLHYFRKESNLYTSTDFYNHDIKIFYLHTKMFSSLKSPCTTPNS